MYYLESVLLNVHIFGGFPTMVLLVISRWMPMVWEHILYNFCFFRFVKVYFMYQNVFCLGEGSMWTWEKWVLHYYYMKCFINYNEIQLLHGAVEVFSVLGVFTLSGIYYSWYGLLKSAMIAVDSSISPGILSVLPHVFCLSVVLHIHMKIAIPSWRMDLFIIILSLNLHYFK